MAFNTTTAYSWVDGEVMTATKLNTAGTPVVADGQGYLFSNTGLTIKDTGGSNSLAIVPGSAMTAARTLTITTGDSDRILTISGNPTINDWFNQSVKTSSSPTFSSISLSSQSAIQPFINVSTNNIMQVGWNSSAGVSLSIDSINIGSFAICGTGNILRLDYASGPGRLLVYIDGSLIGALTPT